MRPRALSGVVTLLFACSETGQPGDLALGTYRLTATPVSQNCQIEEVSPQGLELEVSLTARRGTGEAWVGLSGYVRDAGFVDHIVDSTVEVRRSFASCPCVMTLTERLRVRLLSRSQSEAVGEQCPDRPLEGGVPGADPVAGIEEPGETPLGFDAVRACGELAVRISARQTVQFLDGPDASLVVIEGQACEPKCEVCHVTYRLEGVRR